MKKFIITILAYVTNFINGIIATANAKCPALGEVLTTAKRLFSLIFGLVKKGIARITKSMWYTSMGPMAKIVWWIVFLWFVTSPSLSGVVIMAIIVLWGYISKYSLPGVVGKITSKAGNLKKEVEEAASDLKKEGK